MALAPTITDADLGAWLSAEHDRITAQYAPTQVVGASSAGSQITDTRTMVDDWLNRPSASVLPPLYNDGYTLKMTYEDNDAGAPPTIMPGDAAVELMLPNDHPKVNQLKKQKLATLLKWFIVSA
jgi:hypothetical protein